MMKITRTIKKYLNFFKKKRIVPVPVLTDKDKLLNGKVALITGGSSGIGFAIAEEFLKAGAKVIITSTNEKKLNDALQQIGGRPEELKGITLDVTDVESVNKKVLEAMYIFPEKRIDILVNSAGVRARADFLNITEEKWNKTIDTNLKGTFFMCQAVSKLMIEKKIKGHILNVSSASALRPAKTPYQISKWGIKGMTLGLADALIPYGIVVNAIAPGPTATPMLDFDSEDNIFNEKNPAGRYALPSEIAALAVFMVSDLGDLIVGDSFYMTGGAGTITLHN